VHADADRHRDCCARRRELVAVMRPRPAVWCSVISTMASMSSLAAALVSRSPFCRPGFADNVETTPRRTQLLTQCLYVEVARGA
jgi:hypothetical protein